MKKIKQIEPFEQKSDSKVLFRLKERILRGVNMRKNSDIRDVASLATYLYATEDETLAIQLLDQIIFSIEYNPNNLSLWFEVSHGLSLRTLLVDKKLALDLVNEVSTKINEHDDVESPRQILKKQKTLTQQFIETRKERNADLSEAEISSQKIQCEAYVNMILEDAYYRLMLPTANLDFSIAVASEIEGRIALAKKYLAEALVTRRKACEHRIPRHESFNEKTYRWR